MTRFLAGALTVTALYIAVALLSGVAARRRLAAWARLREDWADVEAALR